ncbi:hypothetical protein GCM10022261_19840 [Brevibacterium daeguense]|uniref:Uncharacterized protein n=1 Tax=Brevibacterium daeguense TaxID=909936 RepID=A0ABP8EKI4_9MICO|nr:hypothetical protein [Brevibacterium daeguense]
MEESTATLGLMADPGLPAQVAEGIAETVAEELTEEFGFRWTVDVSRQRLPLNAVGDIPLFQQAGRLRDSHGWDYLVYLTDLPRIHNHEIMLCDVSAEARAAMVSVPSLGAFRVTKRARRLVSALTSSAQQNTYDYPSEELMQQIMASRPVYRHAEPENDDVVSIFLPGARNRLELLSGMIRSNQPGRLVPALTNSIALALATGAFGVFYGSIWNLADALHPLRLLLISVAVTAVLGIWLIGRNDLWARGRNPAAAWQPRLDNAATVITISLGVVQIYLVIFAVLFVLALTIVEKGYLEEQLGHAVNAVDYLHLSWLSASLGTLAGALGSNFNSEEMIREATYSRRVYERRKLAGSFGDSDDSSD